ncbi:MAG TPA: SRPBCC family protein [Acidimicrobiia bacterium]|nr:SRPBCC family protein [Acidimicrobiia bacterium]
MELFAAREIHRPASEVFAFFSDAANNPKWQSGMISCRWTTEPPIAVGSRYQQQARFLGRDVNSTFVVKALEPGRMVEIETIDSTFPIRVRRIVEPLSEESCRVRAEISGGPERGPLKWLGPLVSRRAQRSVDADYDRLVQLLESASSA